MATRKWPSWLTVFIREYHGLEPGMTSTEVTIVVQIVDLGDRATIRAIAIRTRICERAVRSALKSLESHGYLKRERRSGHRNRYHFEGLLQALGLGAGE